jgi:hypothetical protein
MRKVASREADQTMDNIHMAMLPLIPLSMGSALTTDSPVVGKYIGRASGGLAGLELGYLASKIAKKLGASKRSQNAAYALTGLPSAIALGALAGSLRKD